MTRLLIHKVTLVALMVGTALVAAPVSAQYTNPYTGNTFNNSISSYMDTVILNSQQTQSLQNMMFSQNIPHNYLRKSLQRGGLQMSPQQRIVVDRFAKYRGTMFTAKHPVMPVRLAQKMIPGNAQKSAQLEKLFEGLLKFYEDRSAQQKAPANDLARTMAYCIALNYCYATEQDVSAQGLVELRRKTRDALGSDPKFRALNNAKKQELSETAIILTHFAALGYDQAKEAKDKATMNQFKSLARMNLQALLGAPVERVRLEKTGLVLTE